MPKPPPNLPAPMERVKLRGRNRRGVLQKVNPDTLWASVAWDDGGGMIVHLYELEREAEDAVNESS